MRRRTVKRLPDYSKHSRFAKRIREELRERQWCAGELAEKVGVSLSTVSRWIHGSRLPSATVLERLKSVLGTQDNLIWG